MSLFRQKAVLCTGLGIFSAASYLEIKAYVSPKFTYVGLHTLIIENTIHWQSFLHDECVCACVCVHVYVFSFSISGTYHVSPLRDVGRVKDTGVTLVSVYRLPSNFFISRKCFVISLIFFIAV